MAQSVDPVCGMLVDIATAAGQRRFRDETYHFCSPDCLARFDRDPEHYAVLVNSRHDRNQPPQQ